MIGVELKKTLRRDEKALRNLSALFSREGNLTLGGILSTMADDISEALNEDTTKEGDCDDRDQ